MKRSIVLTAFTFFVLVSLLGTIPGYGITQAAAQSTEELVSIGDTVCFGLYQPDDVSDSEAAPIEWIVLDRLDGKLLLISKDGIETGPYNSEKVRVTWAESSLRTWLNFDFVLLAFEYEEYCAIAETVVTTPAGSFKSPATGEKIKIAASEDTNDLVFLLSVAEVQKYFPQTNHRMAKNSEYLLDRPEETMPYPAEGDACDFTYSNWWLRDVRKDNGIKSGFHVKSNGNIASAGQVNLKRYVIRPALWVYESYFMGE